MFERESIAHVCGVLQRPKVAIAVSVAVADDVGSKLSQSLLSGDCSPIPAVRQDYDNPSSMWFLKGCRRLACISNVKKQPITKEPPRSQDHWALDRIPELHFRMNANPP